MSSLVAQIVKNLPAMLETWVQFVGGEDPLEEGWPPTPWRIPMEKRSLEAYSQWGRKELDTAEWLSPAQHNCILQILVLDVQVLSRFP